MIVRIVKLSFEPTKIAEFLEIFHTNKINIRNFEGCELLELYQDKNETNLFFSYSYWQNETDLNAYRSSHLFNEIWAKTKVLFNNKPQAWSVHKLASLQ